MSTAPQTNDSPKTTKTPKLPQPPKVNWSDEEKSAVTDAYWKSSDTKGFLAAVKAAIPTAPQRTLKAYLSFFAKTLPKEERRSVLYLALRQSHYEEAARAMLVSLGGSSVPNVQGSPTTTSDTGDDAAEDKILDLLEGVSSEPLPPLVPPKTALAPNFVKPPVKPDPNARVPRHIPTPPASAQSFFGYELGPALGVPKATVMEALRSGKIPCHVTREQPTRRGKPIEGLEVTLYEVTRPVFDVLHAALSDGHSFEHACILAMEKLPAPTPVVPAEKLYAPTVEEAPVEPDPNKVREGYIPNPFLKGPFPIEKKQEASTLNDPNPDAKEAFTVEEAAKALGLSNTDTVLTAIHRDGFPAVKLDGKWCLTRADLKRVLALRDSSFSIEEAFKRAGAPPAVEPATVPNDTSWTDHLAPLTPEEEGLAAALPDVVDRDPVWEAVSLEDLANELHIHVASVYQGLSDHPLVQKHGDDLGVPRQAFDLIEEKWRKCRNLEEALDYAAEKLGVLPPPAPATGTGDERVWTLEAVRDGVFTVEQARDILGLKDAARTNWALGLLAAGKVTLDQAAKLLR
jgi:excisionase family DNA binding protein